MKCKICGGEMKWDGLIRTSLPPQYMYKCTSCTNITFSTEKDRDDAPIGGDLAYGCPIDWKTLYTDNKRSSKA